MIKVFTVNGNGKIEFTKAELEKLLNEVYAEGQNNCNCGKGITWTNPYVGPYINCNDSTTTNASTSGAPATATITLNNDEACECANPQRRAYIVTSKFNTEDAKEMSKHIDKIIKNATTQNDVFSKLARELNF